MVQAGHLRMADTTWWHGRTARCAHCRAVGELLLKDAPYLSYGENLVSLPCPTHGCPGRMTAYKPGSTTHEGAVKLRRNR